MKNEINFTEQWNACQSLPFNYKSSALVNKPVSLVNFFVEKMLGKENFEVGVFLYGSSTGSVVSYRELKKEITLRLKKNSLFEIVMTLVNLEGELHTFSHRLSKKEISLLPDTLKKRMYTVKENGQSLFFKGKTSGNG